MIKRFILYFFLSFFIPLSPAIDNFSSNTCLFSYDFLWLTKAISEYGNNEYQNVPTGIGTFVRKPYIRGAPHILFKSANQPITLSFQFVCPLGWRCPACSLNKTARAKLRQKGVIPPLCDYARKIVFIDSCSHMKTSLASLVTDLHKVGKSSGQPLSELFSSTYAFAREMGWDDEQFKAFVSTKMKFPFRLCTSIESLKQWTSVPPKEFFLDKLSNRTHATAEDEENYQSFCFIWGKLQFQNLLQCCWVYSLGDSCFLVDTLRYHYTRMWEISGLFPTFYVTAASLSTASFLLNTRDPRRPKRRILLEFVPEDCDAVFRADLTGGFVSNHAYFRFFSNSLRSGDTHSSSGHYIDANAL